MWSYEDQHGCIRRDTAQSVLLDAAISSILMMEANLSRLM